MVLVGGLVAVAMAIFPYEYLRWTVNRKTSAVEFSDVRMWFFSQVILDKDVSHYNLADYGELTAPNVTYLAQRRVSKWYPWSDDEGIIEESFIPGLPLLEASEALFKAERFVVSNVAREKLNELRKPRLQIWNSPRVESEDPALLTEIKSENFSIILAK